MKISKLTSGVLGTLFCLFLLVGNAENSVAQGKGKNKSQVSQKQAGPPPWAPAHGYRAKTRYVYFSEHNVYYDHERGVYISIGGTNWQISARLPSILQGVDLNAAVKVDLDFSGDEPQRYNKDHKTKFGRKK